jgi:cytochrome c553
MPHRKPLKRLAALSAALLFTTLWLFPVQAQVPQQTLSDPAFAEPKAMSVPFKHNEHNAKAKITKCATCHHEFTEGKQMMTGRASTERRCSYCHQVQPAPTDHTPALMMAYHKLCQDCHRAKGKGPLKCGECHKG